MNNIYAGIDIGTDCIKIVVVEKIKKEFHLLALTKVKSEGMKRAELIDAKLLAPRLTKAKQDIEEQLGTKLKKVIVCVSNKNCIFNIVTQQKKLEENHIINGEDIKQIIKKAITGKTTENYELVTATPINFKIDGEKTVKDPKGLTAKLLETKIVITEVPKEPLYKLLGVIDTCGLEVVDIAFGTTGDYYEVRNSKLDSKIGAIINIGEDTTNICIYNKGIMIKNNTINVGSCYVDRDLTYIYNIPLEKARQLKENFAVASSRYADSYDKIELETIGGTKYNITQTDVSKVVEARIEEILKVSKKEIKNLTNRQISYIIVVGGLSEITGFNYLLEKEFGNLAYTYNSTTIGIRDNSYTSVLGLIKYFDNKLNLRDTQCNMFTLEDIKRLRTVKSKDETSMKKIFDSFLHNKEDKVC
ncbi:MAG: hypothetical protein IKO49_04095 [Bacilli bacterium]|nr:hypothetical protein [Bacilli bacterium]